GRVTVNGPIAAVFVGFGANIVGSPAAPALVCVHWNVHGRRLAGSVHEAVNGPNGCPEVTLAGAAGVYETVGATAPLMFTDTFTETVPLQFVADAVNLKVDELVTSGAVKVAVAPATPPEGRT